MNRDRFRFRMWSEKLNGYYYNMHLTVDGDLVPSKWLEPNSIPDLGRIVVEQCTGVEDKTGRLIYEGDVVCDDDGIKSVVIWLHGGFYLEYKDGGLGDLASFAIELKIIGNVHKKKIMEEKMEEQKDISWSVDFEITINGKECRFEDLSEAAQKYILECIAGDSYSGTFLD